MKFLERAKSALVIGFLSRQIWRLPKHCLKRNYEFWSLEYCLHYNPTTNSQFALSRKLMCGEALRRNKKWTPILQFLCHGSLRHFLIKLVVLTIWDHVGPVHLLDSTAVTPYIEGASRDSEAPGFCYRALGSPTCLSSIPALNILNIIF